MGILSHPSKDVAGGHKGDPAALEALMRDRGSSGCATPAPFARAHAYTLRPISNHHCPGLGI
jgi:hypothetical protein